MSGIVGIINLQAPRPLETAVEQMLDATNFRGPDGRGLYIDRYAGLGRLLLSTGAIQESSATPVNYEGLTITADVRLDNPAELTSRLGLSASNKTCSDAELILQAYKKWGRSCVDHLLGDFAFAIWHPKERSLFCARDHLGVKPLYYYKDHKVFVFASEASAVANNELVNIRLNEARVADYLINELEGYDHEVTFYDQVLRLPPGHSVYISPNSFSRHQYWQLDPNKRINLNSDEDYLEQFNDLLHQAVNSRLQGCGKPALTLSGGVDSGTIAGVAANILKKQGAPALDTYSGVSTQSGCKETASIHQLTEALPVQSHCLLPQAVEDMRGCLVSIVDNPGEPFDSTMLLNALLFTTARQSGHRFILDGVEGDMAHSLPLNYPTTLLRHGHIITAWREAHGVWRQNYQCSLPLRRYQLSLIRSALPTNLRRFFVPNQWRRRLQQSVINPSFATSVSLGDRLKRLSNYQRHKFMANLRDQHAQWISHPYLCVALERYDRVAARCGIEPRHPLLDKRLVEFALAAPWNQKVRHGRSKYLLRRAGKGLVPSITSWQESLQDIGWLFTKAYILTSQDKISANLQHNKCLLEDYVNWPRVNPTSHQAAEDEGIEMTSWEPYLLGNWLRAQTAEITV